jgi:hypothetical protein
VVRKGKGCGGERVSIEGKGITWRGEVEGCGSGGIDVEVVGAGGVGGEGG